MVFAGTFCITLIPQQESAWTRVTEATRNGVRANVLIALFRFCDTNGESFQRCIARTRRHSAFERKKRKETYSFSLLLRPKFWREIHKHMLCVVRCDDGFPLSVRKSCRLFTLLLFALCALFFFVGRFHSLAVVADVVRWKYTFWPLFVSSGHDDRANYSPLECAIMRI